MSHQKRDKMKTILLLTTFLLVAATYAKTYTLTSGKWTDASTWSGDYMGTVIKAGDVVIINGQVTMNISLVVEGTLIVNKSAAMFGMKDLVITKTGELINNGNTVMRRVLNQGMITNNMIVEAMMDIENESLIGNNNMVIAGNNFDNTGGIAAGKRGAYFINNRVMASPSAIFGSDVKVFKGSLIDIQFPEVRLM